MLTNKDLQSFYKLINKRFFKGALPADMKVKFVCGDELEGDEGEHIASENTIQIHEDFRGHTDHALIVLLHECCHAALPDYIGWPEEEDHGDQFEALRGELYAKGAYDELL